MQVVDHEQHRPFNRDSAEKLRQVIKGLLAKLLRVAQQAAQIEAGGEVEAKQVTDDVRFLKRVVITGQELAKTGFDLFMGNVERIAVINLKTERKNIAQERIRRIAHRKTGAPLEPPPIGIL